MLVLARKIMESVVVGGSGHFEQMLKVTVLEINNGLVRLGFEADASVPVHRSEVWERIRKNGGADGALRNPAQQVEPEGTANNR
jgi:carbon storage regulator CsrA